MPGCKVNSFRPLERYDSSPQAPLRSHFPAFEQPVAGAVRGWGLNRLLLFVRTKRPTADRERCGGLILETRESRGGREGGVLRGRLDDHAIDTVCLQCNDA